MRNLSDITVKSFDVQKAEEVLKTCPKMVRDYVKLLKNAAERGTDLTNKAIRSLKEADRQNDEWKKVVHTLYALDIEQYVNYSNKLEDIKKGE